MAGENERRAKGLPFIAGGLAPFAVFMLLGMCFACSLSMEILNGTYIEGGWPEVVKVCAVALPALFAVFYNKYTRRVTAALIGLFVIIMLIQVLRVEDKSDSIIAFLVRIISEELRFIRGYAAYTPELGAIALSVVCVLFCTEFFVFHKLGSGFAVLFATGAAVFVVNIKLGYHYYDDTLMPFLLFSALSLAHSLNRRSGGEFVSKSRFRTSVFALCLAPLCLAVLFVSSSLPKPQIDLENNPVADFFRRPAQALEDFLYLAFNPKYFSFRNTGFGRNDGRLGGNVSQNSSVVMSVRTTGETYLRGTVKAYYDGSSWLEESEPLSPYFGGDSGRSLESYYRSLSIRDEKDARMNLEAFELYHNMGFVPLAVFDGRPSRGSYVSELRQARYQISGLEKSSITVNVLNKRLASLFYPDSYIMLNTESVPLTNGFVFETEELLDSYDEYSFDFLSIDWNRQEMAEVLRGGKRGYYKELMLELDRIREYYGGELEREPAFRYDYSYSEALADAGFSERYSDIDPYEALEILSAASDSYYEKYTQLPENISGRTRQLVAEITRDLLTDYDKAKAIQTYLSAFEYTLTPGETPLENEFVDYFLFDQQKGYCVHFATSLSVMSRLAGIPSRYCEGYIIPASAVGGEYTVTNMQAHAWAELYFEGVGWVRFEPTPNSAAAIAGDDSQYSDLPLTAAGDDVFTDELSVPDDYNRVYTPETEAPAETVESVNWFVITAAGLTVIFGLLIIMAGASLASAFIRPLLMTDRRELTKHLYSRILLLMRKVGRPMRRNETAIAYAADYLITRSVYYRQDRILLAAEVYSKAEYGLDEITEEELQIMKEAYESVKSKIIFAYGKPRYWLMVVLER